MYIYLLVLLAVDVLAQQFAVEGVELFDDGVLRTQATMKYGTKTCKVEIAVAEGEAAVAVTGAIKASGTLSLP